MCSERFFFFVNKYKSLHEHNMHSFSYFRPLLRLTASGSWCAKIRKYLENTWNSDGTNVPFSIVVI